MTSNKAANEELEARMNQLIGDPLMTAKEVAIYIRLSVSSIYRALAANRFPRPMSVGLHKKMWRQSSIDQWLRDSQPGQS